MRKYIFILLMISTFGLTVFSQMHPDDSVRIATLKKRLSIVKNSERVDCLLDLATEFSVRGKDYWDTLQYYITEAQKLATSLNYKKGIAYSILMQGNMELYLKNDLSKAGSLITEANRMAGEIKDNRLLGGTSVALANLQFSDNDNTGYETRKKALQYYEAAKDSESIAGLSAIICNEYFLRGKYEEAFPNCQTCIEKTTLKPIHTPSWTIGYTTLSYRLMAHMYEAAGDYKMAMNLLQKSSKIVQVTHTSGWGEKEMIGDLYTKIGNADSALFYLSQNNGTGKISSMPFLAILFAEAYYLKKDYKQAQQLFLNATNKQRTMRLNHHISRGLVGLAKTYVTFGEYGEALKAAKEAIQFADNNDARLPKKDGYEIVSELYYKSGQYDSAYSYLKKFTQLKDSLLSQQFFFRLNSYKNESEQQKKTSQINLLNKDNQLKEQKLKQQGLVKNSLIIGIILLFLLGVFIFRNLSLKRKNDKLRLQKDLEMQQLASEKKHAELQQQAVELEMQALRAQMNPHFIFNCLSSINRFIFKNDNKLASDYLTRFSRLIRMVLIHSSKKLIPLEDELEMLRLYLDLERLRFKDAFDYSITTTNIVDAGAIFIPPLLLQPFCENAVWHGLMHKESKGHLKIIISEVISEHEKVLNCVIEDDGVGRKKAAEMKSKSAESEKSLGLKITTKRLALLNQENNFSIFYKVEDIINGNNDVAGTRVQLKIKYKETIEEYA